MVPRAQGLPTCTPDAGRRFSLLLDMVALWVGVVRPSLPRICTPQVTVKLPGGQVVKVTLPLKAGTHVQFTMPTSTDKGAGATAGKSLLTGKGQGGEKI